ncbi:MAG TPA: hypothetical protein VFN61_02470 [Acidimicrobiales bacterium]|nr:hypothetical protein [Acidimicrobiales bacterium]
MTPEHGASDHSEALESLAQVLEELGYPSQRLDVHPELPLPTLLVAAPGDEDDDEPVLFNFMFMPIEGTGLEHIDLLQVYFSLLEGVSDERRDDIALVVAELNAQLPLGQLGFQDGEVSLRHMMLLERHQVPSEGLVKEMLAFLLPLRHLLAEAVSAVASGESTVEAALASLP